jgi:hypothetical protein
MILAMGYSIENKKPPRTSKRGSGLFIRTYSVQIEIQPGISPGRGYRKQKRDLSEQILNFFNDWKNNI